MKKQTFLIAAILTLVSITSLSQSSSSVIWAGVVQMNAAQAESASESKGLFIFRLSSDMKLTYKFVVQKMDDGDMLTNAHIHYGEHGVNGSAFIGLRDGIINLGKFVTVQLTQQQFTNMLNENLPIYVNVHTVLYPGDSVRGQIR